MRWWGLSCLAIVPASAYIAYSDDHLHTFTKGLPTLSLLDKTDGALLTPLLVPRVSGTQGATDVLRWMTTHLTHNMSGWKVEEDRFTAKTPLAEVEFVNLIATMDPPGYEESEIGRLVLAAHYDSKMTPPGFIGATDSAVPCAILLYIAQVLSDRLPLYWEQEYWQDPDNLEQVPPRGVQLIFFDGEEAVLEWNDEDSIYGARHLAERWDSERLGPSASTASINKLDSIDLFVLLDLLGAKDATVPSFFATSHWAYRHLAWTEEVLRTRRIAKAEVAQHIFTSGRQEFHNAGRVGDDHMPFMQRGVEILHLITLPFPEVWHTERDDAEHLDQDTIDDLALIFSAFVAQYMELPVAIDNGIPGANRPEKRATLRDEL